MSSQQAEPHVTYEFGDFRLDATRRVLFTKTDSRPLAMKPKVLEAILYFVEHPGVLLEKDQLMNELWPGLVVEENGLAQLISIIRRVLGETPRENRYLATVPGRGYRFVADVVRVAAEAEPPREQPADSPPLAVPATTPPAGARRRLPMLGAFVLLASALAAFTYRGYSGWRAASDTPQQAAASLPAAAELPASTVAVLPFENLSADADNAYVAFGIAESVLHRLAGIQGLTVIARTSSFAVGEAQDVRGIGRTLGARYLVEGSVQRSDERLRVTAQLIDAGTGAHLWSLRFDRTIDDIFAVEDEIAQSLSTALEVSINAENHPYAAFGTEAYLTFLQGRTLVATRRIEDAEHAIERFSRAIEIAPTFAAAYAALADAHRHLAYLRATGTGLTPMGQPGLPGEILAAGVSEAQPLLEQALRLDDSLGEAYILRADLKATTGDQAGAEADYRKGLALSPSYAAGHEHFAQLLRYQGRRDEALAEIDRAILVDPLQAQNYSVKGHIYLFDEEAGVFGEQAEVNFLKALELAPNYHPALVRLGAIRWHQGRFAEAVMLGERALAVDPRAQWIRWFLVEFYLEMRDVDAARSVLAEAPDAVQPVRWLTICLYEEQLERAADLLRAEPGIRGFRDADVPAYVLRDAALASGRPADGRNELRTLPFVVLPVEEDPFASVTRAQLSLALGDRQEAERLAHQVLEGWESDKYRLAFPRAAALTVLAQNDAALDLLEQSLARGYLKRWWYAYDRDPAFEPLRGDPRFQSLAAKAEGHATAERESLRHMRERGELPTRTLKETASPGPC